MQFSDTSTKQGIIEEIDFLVGSDANKYPTADKTRNVNRAMDKVVSIIFTADGRWEYDDSNQTDLPIAFTDLVSSQGTYTLDVSQLIVEKVLVKDSNGSYKVIPQLDISDPFLTSYLESPTSTGTPIYYDYKADTIFLYPAPNYNSTNGLKIFFKRPSTYFTASDTTKTPGFASIFHRYLSLSAAYDFASAKMLPQTPVFKAQLDQMEKDIVEFYSDRNPDMKTAFVPRVRSYD